MILEKFEKEIFRVFFFLINLQNKNNFAQWIRIVASLQFPGKLSDQKEKW